MSLLQTGFLSVKYKLELNTLACHDPKKLSSILQTSFSNEPCPFDLALKMLCSISNKNKNKPRSLCDYVVEALQKWTQEHPQYDVPMEVKYQIVPLVCDFIKANSKALLFLFQVDKPNFAMVEAHIYRFSQKGDYTRMIFLIATLNLQCPVYTDQLVMPMLVQGNSVLAEKYMQGSIGAQQNLLLVVDSWLRNSPIKMFRNVSGAFINQKSLMKLLARWQELFPLADVVLPNLRRQKALDQIRYYLQRYYRDTSMSPRALEDMVHKYINNDRDFANAVGNMMNRNFKDPRRAQKLQQRYNRGWHRGGTDNPVDVWSDSEDDPYVDYYLPLKLDFNLVVMVDSLEKLRACEQHLHNMAEFTTSEECKLIGFDAEFANDQLALIQLAVFDKVFLVDVFNLRQMELISELSAFIERLFTSKRLLKLGFGMDCDLQLLRKEFKNSMPKQPTNLLDVLNLRNAHPRYKLLSQENQPEVAAAGHRGKKNKKLTGLSRMVFQTLGKPLDKRWQISDWERRPLHHKQAIYAATDAYCLLQVYEELDKRLTNSGVKTTNKSLFSISGESSTADNVSKKRQKIAQHTTTTTEVATPSSKQGPVSVRDFRVMCDVMLGDLCMTLRNLGMDATERDANTTIEECVEMAKAEGRHILTSDAPAYDAFCKGHTTLEMCTKLKHDDESNDQALYVINKFQLQITDTDIFSRCQLCNRDKFFILMGHDMDRVHRRKLALESQQQPEPCEEILETMNCGGGEAKSADVTSHLRMNDLVVVSFTDDDRQTEVALKLDSPLPPVDRLFFCCSSCGKIYWKGGHLSEIRQTFANVVVKSK